MTTELPPQSPRETAQAALLAFCPILAAAGITQLFLAYDGGGDEGQFHSVTAWAGDAIVALPDAECQRFETRFDGTVLVDTAPLAQAIDAFGYEALAAWHKGWENGDGGYGEITIEVATQQARLDHNALYTESEHFGTDLVAA